MFNFFSGRKLAVGWGGEVEELRGKVKELYGNA